MNCKYKKGHFRHPKITQEKIELMEKKSYKKKSQKKEGLKKIGLKPKYQYFCRKSGLFWEGK